MFQLYGATEVQTLKTPNEEEPGHVFKHWVGAFVLVLGLFCFLALFCFVGFGGIDLLLLLSLFILIFVLFIKTGSYRVTVARLEVTHYKRSV